ncbi:hypothetical protein J6590_016255, partial [Homalodisca vitripennis]
AEMLVIKMCKMTTNDVRVYRRGETAAALLLVVGDMSALGPVDTDNGCYCGIFVDRRTNNMAATH